MKIKIIILILILMIAACSEDQENPPQALFEVSTTVARTGDTIWFQNTSLDATNFDWDFGDGTGSNEDNPWHTYLENSTYLISLKASNTDGSDEYTKSIRISSWSNRSNIPTARGMHSSSIVNEKIYVISGCSSYGREALHTVEEYDPETDTWTTKSDIPTARECFTTSVVNGKIYAIGGMDVSTGNYHDLESLTTVEEYDPATDSWSTKSPMPSARFAHSASVFEGKIYIFGGTPSFPFSEILNMLIYDPATDSWSSAINIPRPVISSTAVTLNGKIYIIGGDITETWGYVESYYNRLDEYNPVTNTWTQKANMLYNRDDHSCSLLDGKIYVMGGETESYEVQSSVEVYDPITDTWTEIDPLLTRRWTHSSCTVNDKIYVISGLSGLKDYPATNKVEVYYE